MTLAAVLAALDRPAKLPPTRQRDLRSSVKRVANLLGDESATVPLDIAGINARLNTINPLAAGMRPKSLANIRCDFLAAESGRHTEKFKVDRNFGQDVRE